MTDEKNEKVSTKDKITGGNDMPSKKFENLEQEIYSLGIRAHMLNTTRMVFSNKTRYELTVYFLTPRKGEDMIGKQLRADISKKADGVGLHTKFFEKDHFEGAARNLVQKGYSIENGLVAVFLPKYPLSQIKKIIRVIKQECQQSFDYLQEDVAAVQKMGYVKEMEKIVCNFTRTDPEFAVFVGDVQKSPLYFTSQRIRRFYALIGMTKEQRDDFKATSYLLENIF